MGIIKEILSLICPCMLLSKNFSLNELTKSQIATRYGIKNEPNTKQIENLKILCEQILQPVRDHYQLPVVVSSGYRSPAVNAKAGSGGTSQHLIGQAADFEVPGLSNLEVARWISKNLDFDQLILEYYDGKNPNSGWIHCSYGGQQRQQKLIFNGRVFKSW